MPTPPTPPNSRAAWPPDEDAFVFIVGSPRSGTTILGEMLDRHPHIAQWYEPYFIWDRHFRDWSHDERGPEDAGPAVIRQIRRDFLRYRKRSGAAIVVDKSPRNSLKIQFIRAIFPQARFIHLVRDGRDVTLSIHREWCRRRRIVGDPDHAQRFNYRRAFRVLSTWIDRQPFWADKLRSLWFETHGHIINKTKHLHRARWHGAVGWGPRFRGWEALFNEDDILPFNALQWLKCVEAVLTAWHDLPTPQRLEIRYEAMIQDGRGTVADIVAFLGLQSSDGFLDTLPELNRDNCNKWQRAFTPDQIETVETLLAPMLRRLGYDTAAENFQGPDANGR